MNTIRYVFETRPNELNKLVSKYGLAPANPNDRKDLWQKTNFLITKFREDFMKDITDIHPDRDLFVWRFNLDKVEDAPTENQLKEIQNNTTINDTTSNACGCSGANGEKTSGCCGSGVNGEKKSGCCGSLVDGDKFSGCNGECSCKKSSSNISGDVIKEKLKDNMPIVIIASLALVVGVIALSQKTK